MSEPHPLGQRWAFQTALIALVGVLFVSQLSFAMARAPAPVSETDDLSSIGILDRPEDIDLVDLPPGSTRPVIALGDSVMSGARAALRDRFGRIRIDAVVGRQVREGIARLELLRSWGRLGNMVIIQLGNNGRFSSEQFDRIMRVLDIVPRVVFVNVKVPRRWEASVNRVLVAGARRHPGVVLVNWRHYWRDCRGRVFGGDATHLTEAGARCYAKVIAEAALQ